MTTAPSVLSRTSGAACERLVRLAERGASREGIGTSEGAGGEASEAILISGVGVGGEYGRWNVPAVVGF